MTTVGLVADTHGLARPEVLLALGGTDLVLHAGDVGGPDVLAALGRVAPVRAVRGNNDRGAWARDLPVTDVVEVDGVWLYVVHAEADLDLDPGAAGIAAVVTGHSHRPSIAERGGVLFVNPGSAGPRRFRLPVAVGRLVIAAGRVQAETIELAIDR